MTLRPCWPPIDKDQVRRGVVAAEGVVGEVEDEAERWSGGVTEGQVVVKAELLSLLPPSRTSAKSTLGRLGKCDLHCQQRDHRLFLVYRFNWRRVLRIY
jgi:hypothetical protein